MNENRLAHSDTRSSSYSSLFAAGFNSDEISSSASIDFCPVEVEEEVADEGEEKEEHAVVMAAERHEEEEDESIYQLDLLLDQVRTCLDDLRLVDRSMSTVFENIEQVINELDKMIKIEIQEQTERSLEIENILNDFNFLNNMDDEETSKTIDSGFEGEQRLKQNNRAKSHINRRINTIFVDILHRILILLHVTSLSDSLLVSMDCVSLRKFIQNRSKSNDQLVLERLHDQYQQLTMTMSWRLNQVEDLKQGRETPS